MVEVAWLFNSDFEQQTFSGKPVQLNSSKQNQEFEYLIAYLDPEKIIFTSKKYTNDFLINFEYLTRQKLKTSNRSKQIIPWCNDYSYKGECLKYQSKVEFYKYMQENNFHSHESTFVKTMEEVEPGYLYKDPNSVSGIGHLNFPEDHIKIQNKLNVNSTLIKEELLNRTKDFSALIENNKIISVYENIIDRNFYYTGTILTNEFPIDKKNRDEYNSFLESLCNDFMDYRGVMSVDSFLYLKDGKENLLNACEVNLRKTMGYIAFNIKKRYYNESEFFCFRIIYKKTKPKISYEQIYNEYENKIFFLSPLSNRFQVVIFNCSSRGEYVEIEKKLLLKFF
jgi:hypothetical protein